VGAEVEGLSLKLAKIFDHIEDKVVGDLTNHQ
jgi:hypothetical protein